MQDKSQHIRVWDKKSHTMHKIESLKLNPEDPNIGMVTLDNGEIKFFPREADVMVFSDLKDKNERELFDKDVVRFTLEGIHSLAIILRINHWFTLKSIINNQPIPLALVRDTIEYAGNAWENPELFEGEVISQ